MDTKRLSFDIDSDSLEFKPILKKDFLELSMRVISSANPNRNGSWFTKESMENALHTFPNKPILGYFENDDFVSHNGQWMKDNETGMDYWDVWGRKGERMLGLIRESDEVKIVKGSDGLDWVELKCAIWVQYNFKQVKRLLKDAKRAVREGGPAKNVSVEVDITDWEELDNGIIKINNFSLVGITILGSKNGVKVEPGIENAGLSVLDIMGKENFEKQHAYLRQAYAQLEQQNENSEINKKEEFSEMDNLDVLENKPVEGSSDNTIQDNVADPVQNEPVQNFEQQGDGQSAGVCPDCGQEPCVCNKQDDENKPEENQCNYQDDENNGNDNDENDDDNDNNGEGEDKPVEQQGVENSQCDCGGADNYEAKYAELNEKYEALQQENDSLKNENESKKAEFEALSAQFEQTKQDLEEANNKLKEYAHKEFLKEAYALIESAKLDEASVVEFRNMCEKGEVSELQDLKTKVALKVFELISAEPKTGNGGSTIESFNAPINEPTVFQPKENKSTKGNDNPWDRLETFSQK